MKDILNKIGLFLVKALFILGIVLVATGNEILAPIGLAAMGIVIVIANGGVKSTMKKVMYEEN